MTSTWHLKTTCRSKILRATTSIHSDRILPNQLLCHVLTEADPRRQAFPTWQWNPIAALIQYSFFFSTGNSDAYLKSSFSILCAPKLKSDLLDHTTRFSTSGNGFLFPNHSHDLVYGMQFVIHDISILSYLEMKILNPIRFWIREIGISPLTIRLWNWQIIEKYKH